MSASRMTDRPVVRLAGVDKSFARGDQPVTTALEGIDLDIAQGEFVSLIGPSGCGKSTLLRIIGDLISPTRGEVVVNGKPAEQARRDRDYGMVFQAPVLFEWRTVEDNVKLPLEVMGASAAAADRSGPREMLAARRARRLPQALPVAAVGRDAAAGRDRPGARVRAGDPADGRAVRGARRDDPRADELGGPPDLGADRDDGRVRDPLDPRGGVPLVAGRRDERPAGADHERRSTSTCRGPRNEDTRETRRYFELVTEVREALRTGDAGEPAQAPTTGELASAERTMAEGAVG